MERPVAVFDIDGTVFRSALLIELVEALVARGIFTPSARDSYHGQKEDWLNRKGEYQPFISKVVEAFASHAKGVPFQDVAEVANEIAENQKDRVYRYTRDLIAECRTKGYFLLAISHSPKFIVEPFTFAAGFDKSYGTFYETGPSDRFTGTIADPHLILNKASILKRAVEKDGLTLTNSIGVGDTESDISMLEMVERPIAFNPNMLLYKHAQQYEWEVVVERKDVVYEL